MTAQSIRLPITTLGGFLIFLSLLVPHLESWAWFGFGVIYFASSVRLYLSFQDRFLLESKAGTTPKEIKFFNSAITQFFLTVSYGVAAIAIVYLINNWTANESANLKYLETLRSILPFFNLDNVAVNGINGSLETERQAIKKLVPFLTFIQLGIIQISLVVVYRGFVRRFAIQGRPKLLYFFIVNITLIICSLCTFLFALNQGSIPGILLPFGFLWLANLGPSVVALDTLLKEQRRFQRIAKFCFISLIASSICIATVSSEMINRSFFLVGVLLFFFFVSLRMRERESTIKGTFTSSHYKNRSYRIFKVIILVQIISVPIENLLSNIRPEAPRQTAVYLALLLSLLPIPLLLKFENSLAKEIKFSNWLSDYLWVVNKSSRTSYNLNLGRKSRILVALIVVTYTSSILLIDVQVKDIKRGLEFTSQQKVVSLSEEQSRALNDGVGSSSARLTNETSTSNSFDTAKDIQLDSDWQRGIAAGLQLVRLPSQILENLTELTKDKSLASSDCKNTVSEEFRSSSEVSLCRSEIPDAPLALFVGNSHGAMVQDVVSQSFNELGYSEIGIFTSSCTISPKIVPLLNAAPVKKCKNFGEDIARYVLIHKPDIILISQSLNISVLNDAGNSVAGPAAANFLITNLEKTIRKFQATTPRVILIDAFPVFPQISSCMGASGILKSCVTTTSSTNIYRQVNRIIAQSTQIGIVETLPWVCYQGRCPAVFDNLLISPDGSHVTKEFAMVLKPQIKLSLKSMIS